MDEKFPFVPAPPPPRRPFLGWSLCIAATTTLLVASILVLWWPLMILQPEVDDLPLPAEPLLLVLPAYVSFTALVFYWTPALKRLSRKGRRMAARRALATLERDPRPPVLLLRSFGEDDLLDPASATYVPRRFEEPLAHTLRRIGPVVALGHPGVSEPELGAPRLFVRDEDWQVAIRHFLERAAAVALIVGRSPGLWWEVENAVRAVRPEQLLFVFPYVFPPRLRWLYERLSVFFAGTAISSFRNRFFEEIRAEREDRYAEFRVRAGPLFEHGLPEALGPNVCLVFDADGVPRFLDRALIRGLWGGLGKHPEWQLHVDFPRELRPFLARFGVRTRRWPLRLFPGFRASAG